MGWDELARALVKRSKWSRERALRLRLRRGSSLEEYAAHKDKEKDKGEQKRRQGRKHCESSA